MLSARQTEIIGLLEGAVFLNTRDLIAALGVSRARLNQLITPLIKGGVAIREGKARATVYRLSGRKSKDQITVENWKLRRRVIELERTLEDRKVIERAKEIIIAQFDILPTEAYRKLQEQSMESGRSMREIAQTILSAYEG